MVKKNYETTTLTSDSPEIGGSQELDPIKIIVDAHRLGGEICDYCAALKENPDRVISDLIGYTHSHDCSYSDRITSDVVGIEQVIRVPDDNHTKAALDGVENPEMQDALTVLDESLDLHEQTTANVEGISDKSSEVARGVLDQLDELATSDGYYPKKTILGGGNRVEDHQLTFIRKPDGSTVLQFRLTENAHEEAIGSLPVDSESRPLQYVQENQATGERSLTDTSMAFSFDYHGLEISVVEKNTKFRSYANMVFINIPSSNADRDNDFSGELLDKAMDEVFKISDAFVPDNEALEEYERGCYLMHHGIESDSGDVPLSDLKVSEVFPGHFAVTEPGKYEEYEREYGEVILTHELMNDNRAERISAMLMTGIMSTRERFDRGIYKPGWSSYDDLVRGGAESVFTRAMTSASLGDIGHLGFSRSTIIIKPSTMDRTDWYSYDDDRGGNTSTEFYKEHNHKPEELLGRLNNEGFTSLSRNEQMFNTGISPEDFAALSVENLSVKHEIISILASQGVAEVNGVAIEDFIYVGLSPSQAIDIAHGRYPRDYSEPTDQFEHLDLEELAM